jgi:hypothetical protein
MEIYRLKRERMQYFDEFDEEKETNPDTKLSVLEKGTILTVITAVKLLTRKAAKAKTYGDLYKVMNKVSKFIDEQGEGNSLPKEETSTMSDEDKTKASAKIEELAKQFHEKMEEQKFPLGELKKGHAVTASAFEWGTGFQPQSYYKRRAKTKKE